MKIALCLSGLPRTFVSCYPSIKEKIIDAINCDCFISTWNVIAPPYFEIEGAVRYGSEGTLDKLRQLYNPIMFEIEDYNNEQKENFLFNQTRFIPRKHPHSNITRNLSMDYKVFKAKQLAETYEVLNNFTYDVIIKCRLDLKITNQISFKELEDSAVNNTFYSDVIRGDGMVSDILYFSSGLVMKKVCNKFLYTDKIYNDGIEFNPEKTLVYYLKNMLSLECKQHSMKPVIIRPEHVKW